MFTTQLSYCLGNELALQESAIIALHTWRQLASSVSAEQLYGTECFYDVTQSIEAMMLLATILRLSRRVSV